MAVTGNGYCYFSHVKNCIDWLIDRWLWCGFSDWRDDKRAHNGACWRAVRPIYSTRLQTGQSRRTVGIQRGAARSAKTGAPTSRDYGGGGVSAGEDSRSVVQKLEVLTVNPVDAENSLVWCVMGSFSAWLDLTCFTLEVWNPHLLYRWTCNLS